MPFDLLPRNRNDAHARTIDSPGEDAENGRASRGNVTIAIACHRHKELHKLLEQC
jgi:hypothetical protein